jgi:hypothetical protein
MTAMAVTMSAVAVAAAAVTAATAASDDREDGVFFLIELALELVGELLLHALDVALDDGLGVLDHVTRDVVDERGNADVCLVHDDGHAPVSAEDVATE